jgi:hypothetical protein
MSEPTFNPEKTDVFRVYAIVGTHTIRGHGCVGEVVSINPIRRSQWDPGRTWPIFFEESQAIEFLETLNDCDRAGLGLKVQGVTLLARRGTRVILRKEEDNIEGEEAPEDDCCR